MTEQKYTLLPKIDSPSDLKRLSIDQLATYCDELRRYIVEACSVNPGHLGSSLGAVELTVALHYVFDAPNDKLVWDVGHQTYAHKIITERREAFLTQRKLNGLSGFPRMDESVYDAFGGGHASVSISAAYGMAAAAALDGDHSKQIVAIIGDASMTGGLAFEGLNNAGAAKDANLLVILNDNNMAIDPGTGALKSYLTKITSSHHYNRFKQWAWSIFTRTPRLQRMLRKMSNALKQVILGRSNLFESFNFRYFGPINGHNVQELVRTLRALRDIRGPKLLHVLTVKGKGYAPAEDDPATWHAPGRFDVATGDRPTPHCTLDRYQDVFGQTLLDLARMDERVVGITAAMPSGCGMSRMMEQLPDRVFDVGIAEGHAVTFAAGLATAGKVPFCAIYSTFMQRAYDNVIHDVAIQHLPVIFCLDRGGLVGEDGVTHHGVFDMAAYATVPSLTIAAPRNEKELRDLMYTALQAGKPWMIRYPRGEGEGEVWRDQPFCAMEEERGECLRKGRDVAVLTIGTTASAAARAIQRAAAEGIEAAHYDLRFVKPLDTLLLDEVADQFERVITVEDGALRGGVGEAVTAYLNERDAKVRVTRLGIPDRWIEQGKPVELHALCGYDEEGIYQALKAHR